jgi:2'-5' RNA ligase
MTSMMQQVDDVKNSVMVALLPTTSYWCKQDLPHMTLVYAGEIPDLRPTVQNELTKAALDLSMTYRKFTLDVIRVGELGDNPKVEVLLLKPTQELIAMRKVVEPWNGSEFKVFKPHATIGPVGSSGKIIPSTLTFDRIMVGWGDNRVEYKLL